MHHGMPTRSTVAYIAPMPVTSVLLNLLWIVFGGLWMAAGWFVAALVMAITIVGLPWTRAAFNIALYTLLPFGQTAVSRAAHTGREDLLTALLLAITVIGIPFAWAHLKLAGLALWPIGKMIVPLDEVVRPRR